jgi:ubiquitin carboxyl-terminal hydrolase 14
MKVNVKWINGGGKVYKGIELDPNEEPLLFKGQVFALTGVPVDRQKLMLRGRVLSSDGWARFPVKQLRDGVTLTLMGSAEELPKAPEKEIVFEEDLNVLDRARLLHGELPPGLENLGNTCYMNSTLQMFKAVPELKEALKAFARANGCIVSSTGLPEDGFAANLDPAARLLLGAIASASSSGSSSSSAAAAGSSSYESMANALGTLMGMLDGNLEKVLPIEFVNHLRTQFPQFDQKTDDGHPMQHDADECMSAVLNVIDRQVGPVAADDSTTTTMADDEHAHASVISQLFHGHMEVETRCVESDAEPAQRAIEPFRKLTCHIDINTNFLNDGIESSLAEQITKHSALLERNAVFEKKKAISRLPKYLFVQFVRFLWKGKEGVKAKICRPVEFPDNLDMFRYCSPTLQAKLAYKRDIHERNEAIRSGAAQPTEDDEQESSSSSSSSPSAPIADRFENESGYYELTGVLTHQGRSADGGHYVAWIRDDNDPDKWILFDDDRVSSQPKSAIRKLVGKGGSDWHIAYICLYRSKEIHE